MLQVGSWVKVRDNAYEGSDEPKDLEARGKTGEIVYDSGGDMWEVRIGDAIYPLLSSELEEIDTQEAIKETARLMAQVEPKHGRKSSELYQYPVWDGDDVTRCPRCNDVDIFPGQRVCNGCLDEIRADDL